MTHSDLQLMMVLFFHSVAFFILGSLLLLLPKRNPLFSKCVGCDDCFIYFSLFAYGRAANNFIDLLIHTKDIWGFAALNIISNALLPVSFIFLFIFATRILYPEFIRVRFFKHLWVFLLLAWSVIVFSSHNILLGHVFVRHVIVFPGALLLALGMYLRYRKIPTDNLSAGFKFNFLLFTVSIIIYGFLAGLITPKVDSIFSPVFDYNNFWVIFKFPVQFFRMICILLIAISFVFLSSQSIPKVKDELKYFKGGVRRKVILYMSATLGIMVLVGISLGYLFGSQIVYKNIVEDRKLLLARIVSNVNSVINHKTNMVGFFAQSVIDKHILQEINKRYQGMSGNAVSVYMAEMNGKWLEGKLDSELVFGYLYNDCSKQLMRSVFLDHDIAGLLLTDKMGAVACATYKSRDFYLADKLWWKKASELKGGGVFIESPLFESAVGKFVFPFACPVRGQDGEFLGVCRIFIDVTSMLYGLADFSFGKTGHASIIENNGHFIYHYGVCPLIPSGYKFRDLINGRVVEDTFLKYPYDVHRKQDVLYLFAPTVNPHLIGNGMEWFVFLEQDKTELLSPLNRLFMYLMLLFMFLIAIVMPLAFIFAKSLSDPIEKLCRKANDAGEGNYDAEILINSRDEIEELSHAFSDMLRKIKKEHSGLVAEKAYSDISRNNLLSANRAMISIMEDLQQSQEDLKLANMRLKELDRLKSDFVSVVSHELRSPLAMVRESIAQVTEGIHGEVSDKQRRFLFMAVNNIDRLARIISDLLDISRIESGKINLHKDFYDLVDLMENSLALFDSRIKGKNLEIIREYTANSERVAYVDRDRIIQVFNNLIENAVKFTERGHIKVWVHCTNNIVECAVVDTGTGIAEDNISKLFNKFEQFSRAPGTGPKGTGLGLSIVKGIIELHGGSVWAESKLGEGSAFGFRIPIHKPSDFARECLTLRIDEAFRGQKPLSIIVFSIKNMPELSQRITEGFAKSLSHMAGNILRNSVQYASDICAKNDHGFLVFLPGLSKREVLSVASKSKYVLEDYFKIELKDFKVDIDFEIISFPDDGSTEEEIRNKIL